MKTTCIAVLLAALSGCAGVGTSGPMGTKPSYLALEAVTKGVPNEAALSNFIWTPGLDDNYVPQGLTSSGGYLFVSSYKPTPDLKANTGPCRIFRIEAKTGKAAGHFDIPPGVCTHAGGLAHVGNGKLFISDTRQVFMIELDKALATGTSVGASKGVRITGELRGSYSTFDGKDFWIGTWTKEQPKARMFRLDPQLFDNYDGQTVTEARATESIPVPLEAQGAAFDKAGNLWVSASDSKFGRLYKLDRQGKVLAQYEMVPGLEDLTVDESGQLWGLSESGTRKYIDWGTRFPFVFGINPDKLK